MGNLPVRSISDKDNIPTLRTHCAKARAQANQDGFVGFGKGVGNNDILPFCLGGKIVRLGFAHGDQVAAIAVGLMVIWVGVRIVGDSLRELSESATDAETIEQIEDIINSDPSVRQWHKLRTRTVGREVFLDLHILVDPDLSVAAAHEIAERLERTLDEQITRPINILVHVEPDMPELRR